MEQWLIRDILAAQLSSVLLYLSQVQTEKHCEQPYCLQIDHLELRQSATKATAKVHPEECAMDALSAKACLSVESGRLHEAMCIARLDLDR